MQKSVLVFSMASLLILGGLNMAIAQEQPKPKKDTINMDTDAKPTFYYAVEDDAAPAKSGSTTIAIIAGIVVVIAVGGFILLKKKKK